MIIIIKTGYTVSGAPNRHLVKTGVYSIRLTSGSKILSGPVHPDHRQVRTMLLIFIHSGVVPVFPGVLGYYFP